MKNKAVGSKEKGEMRREKDKIRKRVGMKKERKKIVQILFGIVQKPLMLHIQLR
jgi:hypothetical protein